MQRRQTALAHPRSPARSAAPEPQAEATPAAAPTGWDGFSQALGNDAQAMVLESWSLEDPANPAHHAGHGGGGGQFDQVAGATLQRLNEERANQGQPPLSQLPHEEEQRIWAQVQGSGGGSAAAGAAHQPAPIRDWADFGSALSNDFADQAGGYFGTDAVALSGSSAIGGTAAGTAAGTATTTPDHAEDPPELDLELLTTQLYDRIRSRLRRELLLDRERAGLLSDFR